MSDWSDIYAPMYTVDQPPIHNPRGLPVVPRLPDHAPGLPRGPVAICGECGREIHAVEGYCCMNLRCPVQTVVTC